MKESLIKKYFENIINAKLLHDELILIKDSSKLTSNINFFCDLKTDYSITISCLIKLCKDYLEGSFKASDIESLSFFLMGSDHFTWDCDTKDGAIVAEIIDHWCTPEIDFPINIYNMKIIYENLLVSKYDTSQLKK